MKTTVELTREAGGFDASTEFLERLIALARSDEREACAKIADRFSIPMCDSSADDIALLIRARGNT